MRRLRMIAVPCPCPRCTREAWAQVPVTELAYYQGLPPARIVFTVTHAERGCGADVVFRAGDVIAAAEKLVREAVPA